MKGGTVRARGGRAWGKAKNSGVGQPSGSRPSPRRAVRLPSPPPSGPSVDGRRAPIGQRPPPPRLCVAGGPVWQKRKSGPHRQSCPCRRLVCTVCTRLCSQTITAVGSLPVGSLPASTARRPLCTLPIHLSLSPPQRPPTAAIVAIRKTVHTPPSRWGWLGATHMYPHPRQGRTSTHCVQWQTLWGVSARGHTPPPRRNPACMLPLQSNR